MHSDKHPQQTIASATPEWQQLECINRKVEDETVIYLPSWLSCAFYDPVHVLVLSSNFALIVQGSPTDPTAHKGW